jgi:hypothetical protein
MFITTPRNLAKLAMSQLEIIIFGTPQGLYFPEIFLSILLDSEGAGGPEMGTDTGAWTGHGHGHQAWNEH